jgi:ribosomal protein S27E
VALQLQDKPIVQQQGLGFGGRTYHHGHRQTAFAWNNTRYTRRSPESTLLYKVVQENLRSFEDLCREEGKHLPGHVTKEFEAFLKCGVLAHGFLRFRCVDCKHERLVAFSCKKRGFCGSCGARRMAETAAHLTDNVFPTSTIIRQWV